MFMPSEFAAPIRVASSYDVITFAPVFFASSAALPTWSEWPCVTRIASSALGCSIFGAIGLSSQGSIAIVAPPGVWMIHAAWPHQVAVVAVGGAVAGGAGCLPGTTGGAIPGFSAMIGVGAGAEVAAVDAAA